jgi:hypothetical protein
LTELASSKRHRKRSGRKPSPRLFLEKGNKDANNNKKDDSARGVKESLSQALP